MKYIVSLIAAAATLGWAATALSQSTEPQSGPQAQTQSTDPSLPATRNSDMSAASSQASPAASGSTSANPRLAAIVPAGMSMQEACTGFKSVDECLATLHVAQNLSIPFDNLKTRVTRGASLGAALKQLKPGVDVKAETRRAAQQAQLDTRVPQG